MSRPSQTEPSDGFMDAEFAKFREERLRTKGKAHAAPADASEPATTPTTTPAEPEHLDGADDDFARFRAARLREGGRPATGRHRLPAPPTEASLEPARSTRTRTALEPSAPATASEQVAPAHADVCLEPHRKAALPAVEESAEVAHAPVVHAPAAPPVAPEAAAPEGEPGVTEPDFDRFRAQRAANRQQAAEPAPTAQAREEGLFFGTSSQERRSVTARVREARTDVDDALASPSDGPPALLVPARDRTPARGEDRAERPAARAERTPANGEPAAPRRTPPPPLPARESA